MERTDVEVLAAQPVDVTLGGQKYSIRPIKFKNAIAFSKRLNEILQDVQILKEILSQADIRVYLAQNVTAFLPILKTFLEQTGPELLRLIFVYDDALKVEQERIESEATLDEMLICLAECVRIAAHPFLRMPRLIRALGTPRTSEPSETEESAPKLSTTANTDSAEPSAE
jgi:hypothetical protein